MNCNFSSFLALLFWKRIVHWAWYGSYEQVANLYAVSTMKAGMRCWTGAGCCWVKRERVFSLRSYANPSLPATMQRWWLVKLKILVNVICHLLECDSFFFSVMFPGAEEMWKLFGRVKEAGFLPYLLLVPDTNGPLSELAIPPVHTKLEPGHLDQLKTIMAR